MKIIEKIALIIYSIIVLILSVVCCLLIFNWLQLDSIINILENMLEYHYISTTVLVVSIIFILLSLKCIFFGSKKSDIYKDNILLKNEEGKLIITKSSIENLVNNTIKGFSNVQEFTTKVKLNKENEIIVDVSLQVKENAIIRELSDNMQARIKQAVKKTSDLDIKEVNIKIKHVEQINNIIKE